MNEYLVYFSPLSDQWKNDMQEFKINKMFFSQHLKEASRIILNM